jgi:hypothetical protein
VRQCFDLHHNHRRQQDGEPVRREAAGVVALPVVRERAWRPTARIPQVPCRSAEFSVLLALPSA